MIWIVANTMSEYVRYTKECPKNGETRYVALGEELYGVRGEVIIVNGAERKFDTTAHETLAAFENYGLIKVKRVYF
ncbi:hypothetical protein [Pseudobacillus badius]|uniref:hypothetical protein n=1 Tax=Bacillus badius TaxID=1455 RepID=UPI0007B34B34|nr:hypothetical protein [Bacillus badius]KZR57531.1 hypothetical protein A3781_19760 [Bacillus badius]